MNPPNFLKIILVYKSLRHGALDESILVILIIYLNMKKSILRLKKLLKLLKEFVVFAVVIKVKFLLSK